MMQIAIKHWENPTPQLYSNFLMMTFGLVSDNFILFLEKSFLSGITGQHIWLFSDY